MASDAAQAAAKWWAECLAKPGVPDNGDRSEAGGLTAMLAVLTQKPSSGEAIFKFEAALAAEIDAALTRGGSCWLSVDYEPDGILAHCAENAGLDPGMAEWPWKTHMTVQPDVVSVAKGYRAETVQIFPVVVPGATGATVDAERDTLAAEYLASRTPDNIEDDMASPPSMSERGYTP